MVEWKRDLHYEGSLTVVYVYPTLLESSMLQARQETKRPSCVHHCMIPLLEVPSLD